MPIGEGTASTNQAVNTYARDGVTVGFFTDPTLCIGCKACEVACKEWNQVPDDGYDFRGFSYDNTGELGSATWRHVKFVEEEGRLGLQVAGRMTGRTEDGRREGVEGRPVVMPERSDEVGREAGDLEDPFRWLFVSDVCRHCEVAGCLEACPTGSIVRTETGAVYVQDDVCNGCGYCVTGCPFGVIDRRPKSMPGAGGAFKCTFCYDRQRSGLTPACAKACPTESIQFGPLEDLRERARHRVDELKLRGFDDVALYDPQETSVKGLHAFFLVPGDPARFGLPPAPEAPTRWLMASWLSALVCAVAVGVIVLVAFGAAS